MRACHVQWFYLLLARAATARISNFHAGGVVTWLKRPGRSGLLRFEDYRETLALVSLEQWKAQQFFYLDPQHNA